MTGLLERAAGLVRDRERRDAQADVRARSAAMTAARGRRERLAHAERRLAALRVERDAALRTYESRLRLELQHALAALRAAQGQERVHPLAPYATRPVAEDPAAAEEAQAVVAMIRAEMEAAGLATRPAA